VNTGSVSKLLFFLVRTAVSWPEHTRGYSRDVEAMPTIQKHFTRCGLVGAAARAIPELRCETTRYRNLNTIQLKILASKKCLLISTLGRINICFGFQKPIETPQRQLKLAKLGQYGLFVLNKHMTAVRWGWKILASVLKNPSKPHKNTPN
jgi:hypothetical protein